MLDLIGVLLMAVCTLGAGLGGYRARGDLRVRRLLPGVAVTVAAFDLLIAAYLWWFQVPSSCGGRGSVVCVINGNQGFLTLLAVVIAATGIWVGMITAETVRHRALRREVGDTLEALSAACAEVYHNLLHVALAFDEDELDFIPTGLSLDTTLELSAARFRANLPPSICSRLDPLKRNLDRTREVQDKVQTAKGWRERRVAREVVKSVPAPLRGFITTSLSFVRDCYEFAPEACEETLGSPGLRDLDDFTHAMEPTGSAWTVFCTGELADRAAAIRNSREPIMCWFDDSPIGVPTFALGPKIDDEAADHRH